MRTEFNEAMAGSAYSIGDENSRLKILLLHGQGGNALEMSVCGQTLLQMLKTPAHIIIPNGGYKISTEVYDQLRARQRGVLALPSDHIPYSWYPLSSEMCGEDDAFEACLSDVTSDPENRVHFLGFSMGGFRAAEEMLSSPHKYTSAVLHSSGMVVSPRTIVSQPKAKSMQKKILTIMGCKDEYMRNLASLPLITAHFRNQVRANRANIGAKTELQWDLEHGMNLRSLSRAAKHIQDLDGSFDL